MGWLLYTMSVSGSEVALCGAFVAKVERRWSRLTRMTGRSEHNLDAKGRLILPARFRAVLGSEFYLAPGYHVCPDGTQVPNLTVYPMEAWDRICEKLDSLPENLSYMSDAFFAHAERCEPDSQFRIVIPQGLREYAGLKKTVVLTGSNTKAKLWDADTIRQTEGMRLNIDNITAMMKALG